MKKTVVQYLLTRLYDIGVSDIFGVAGDYSFPINDARRIQVRSATLSRLS
ncbi:hypothetical protein [Providencia sp. PROV272]